LAGWKIRYVPTAIAYHQIGATSGKIKGFTTYQTMKNLQVLLYKNVPREFMWRVLWRFSITHFFFFGRAVLRGHLWPAAKGDFKGTWLLFKKSGERRRIQKSRTVSNDYVWSMLTHDLPPNARALRSLRHKYRKLVGRKAS
jgi:GT2 family glycosyltransferase